jgi:serine/threonine protein kinase
MIKGDFYTQAADIWSSGILLYSMTTGMLPFDDGNLETLFKKIVTQEPSYPTFLSPALIDLLKKMLSKSPDLRITLEGLKGHDWFSQTQYAALFAMKLGERSTEKIVDSKVVEEMTEMGIETATLRQQLLLGMFTELTAMYRMLKRYKMTDEIRNKISELPGNRGAYRSFSNRSKVEAVRVERVNGTKHAMAYSPGPTRGPMRFGIPASMAMPGLIDESNRIAATKMRRRLSRPLAITRAVQCRVGPVEN